MEALGRCYGSRRGESRIKALEKTDKDWSEEEQKARRKGYPF